MLEDNQVFPDQRFHTNTDKKNVVSGHSAQSFLLESAQNNNINEPQPAKQTALRSSFMALFNNFVEGSKDLQKIQAVIQQFSQLGIVTTGAATVAAVGVAQQHLRTKKHLAVSPYPDIHHQALDMTNAHGDESREGLQQYNFTDSYQGIDPHQ